MIANYKLKAFLLVLILTLLGCTQKKSTPPNILFPNILFIMSDDHTSQAWGIYGGVLKDYVKNENIQRLSYK